MSLSGITSLNELPSLNSQNGHIQQQQMMNQQPQNVILNRNEIDVISTSIQVETFKALEDNLELFQNRFIDPTTGNIKNNNLFKRRILGLTSYFRSAQEQLMPEFNKDTDFKVIKIPMSDFQFGVYEQARIQERKIAKAAAKKKLKQVFLLKN